MMILINIRDHKTGTVSFGDSSVTDYSYMLDSSTTLQNLKEKFVAIKGGTVKVEDICAWTELGTPLVNNDNTLEQYNLDYDDIVINMATNWTEEIKDIL
jgi:hypothetical protein